MSLEKSLREAVGSIGRLDQLLAEERAECARLKQWKAEQMAVESEWDAQAVARELDMPPGKSIRAEILPRVVAMKAHIAELESGLRSIAGMDETGIPSFTPAEIARELLEAKDGEK